MTLVDRQKKALEWFKGHSSTCGDCPKCFDLTCSGADSNRCLAYREAIGALQTAVCKAEHESTQITRPEPWGLNPPHAQ